MPAIVNCEIHEDPGRLVVTVEKVYSSRDHDEIDSNSSTSNSDSNGSCMGNGHSCTGVNGLNNLDFNRLPPNKCDTEMRQPNMERKLTRISSIIDPPKDYIRMISRGASMLSAVSNGPKMEWGSIWIAAIILFILSMQFSIYMASMWPYLTEIDPTANQTFYGFILASYSLGQMLMSPVMGYLYNRIKHARPILASGICIAVVGNLVYMFAEASASNRKWILMVARFLIGLGAGTSGTIRAYLGMASTFEHRARAVAIGTAALSLGATAGPAIQTCATPIGYPGLVLGPFHINQYTAAAYVSVLGSVVLLALLYTKFKESRIGIDDGRKKDPYHIIPKYDKLATILCIFAWFTVFFCRTNSDSVESPYTMAVFNWDNDDAVRYNSIIMSCSSVLSFILYVLMAVYGERINERAAMLVGLYMLCGFYAFTFSWPFYTGHLTFKSASIESATVSSLSTATSNSTGCDPEMEWCNYTARLPMPVYLAAYPLLSAGLPICTVGVSTLFSKILGPRQQGFMQSMMMTAGALARLLGPILITWLFTIFGPRVAWTMTTAVVTICITATVMGYNRLVPLNTKPKLKSGDKVRYDEGTLYRF